VGWPAAILLELRQRRHFGKNIRAVRIAQAIHGEFLDMNMVS
jgi:hypothetical protein